MSCHAAHCLDLRDASLRLVALQSGFVRCILPRGWLGVGSCQPGSAWVTSFSQVLGWCRFCVLPNPFLEVCWSGVREASLAHVAELAVAEAGRSGRRQGIADGALLSLDRCYQDLRLDYHIDVSVQTSYYFSFFLSFLSPFFYSTTFSFFLPSLHLPPFPVSSLSLYGGKNYDYTCCI